MHRHRPRWRTSLTAIRRPHRRAAVLFAAALPLTATVLAAAAPSDQALSGLTASDKVSAEVTQLFEKAEGEPQDVWVRFESAPDLTEASSITNWEERGAAVVAALQDHAEATQRETVQTLKKQGVTYTSFWISNAIKVNDGTPELVAQLAALPEVEEVAAPMVLPTPSPVERHEAAIAQASVEWGLSNINADDVWATGVTGAGIVVGSLDTGVQYDHPALVNQYRGNNHDGTFSHDYNWFDPSGACTDVPCDRNDHGTHTTGTMVGADGDANQIGVAPDARWIAANGCDPCSRDNLLAAAQWMLAPTKIDGSDPDAGMRPHIINNSWGSTAPSFDAWFDDITTAWAASGIFGVWANGNIGPSCETSGTPGSRTANYSVGAYDSSNVIGEFSSRGPGLDGEIKPNIAAPGVAVRSSVPGGGYEAFNGTSMAAPHVAGAIALLWSAGPDLVGDLDATRDLLDLTARDTEDLQCGGTAEDNNVFGEGRLDAAALVAGREVGLVAGRVTDQSDSALAGAAVSISGGTTEVPLTRTVFTGQDGTYQLALPAGDYTVAVTAYGYLSTQAQVSIAVDATTTQDFALEAAAMATVSGQVTDGSGQGWPLYAGLTIAGYPNNPVYTDPETGTFSVQLPRSADYVTEIDPVYPGYEPQTTTVTVGEADVTVDVALTADLEVCTAPGYGWNGLSTEFTDWDAQSAQQGWQIDAKGPGAWRFDNPQMRMQPPMANGSFAIADPATQGRKISTILTSPVIDLSGQDSPSLTLDMRYLGAAKNAAAIEYSADGGDWTAVWTGGSDHVVGSSTFDLSAAGDSVQVRFSYTGSGDDAYWAIDNVFVGTRECILRDGGLLIGDVRDAASGSPVPWATTSLSSAGVEAFSEPFPGDQNRSGALYWLFGAEGSDTLTVSHPGYDDYAADVSIAPGTVTRHDVDLAAVQN